MRLDVFVRRGDGPVTLTMKKIEVPGGNVQHVDDPVIQPPKEQFNYGNARVKPMKQLVALSSDMARY